ncbi:MAG: cadmium-translocating P-type ATPase [Phycisphaeraceae bacterium]|nr:cadmium-translocating P-type ATPase [Phycisphaeraceae bacterium]
MKQVRLRFAVSDDPSPDAHVDCARCIEDRLTSEPGVRHVRVERDENAMRVELEYDPELLPLSTIQGQLHCQGACLPPDLVHMTVPVEGLNSDRIANAVESSLNRLPGVAVVASYAAGTIRLEFDRRTCQLPQIVDRLRQLGLRPDFHQAQVQRQAGGHPLVVVEPIEPRWQPLAQVAGLFRWLYQHPEAGAIVLSALLLAAGWGVHLAEGPMWLRLTLLAAAAIAASLDTFPNAIATLRTFRLDVDVLMFAAAAGAAALGQYEEGVLLLFLFGAGAAGEHLALSRARNAILALSSVAPQTAFRLKADGSQEEIPVEQLAVGDRLIVRPFDRVPADAAVTEGASSLDQSAITGESMPVSKEPGDVVFAGTLNGEGRLVVTVSKLAAESTLAQIVRLVQEAQTAKSPTELFTDRIESIYVPIVFVATGLLIFIPPLLNIGGTEGEMAKWGLWGLWFYRAMAFLTAASPCALAIGTPAAVLCGIARAARVGVLVKGGAYLQSLGGVKAIIFDKTGTLTPGKPTLTDVLPLNGTDESQLLAIAAGLEQDSSHPLAEAISAAARQRRIAPAAVTAVEQTPSLGIRGQLDGSPVAIGKPSLAADPAALESMLADLNRQGKTAVAVFRDGKPIGVLALIDQPRPNCRHALDRLRKLGVEHLVMATGDHPTTAHAIAEAAGVNECHADLLPADKLKLVDELIEKYGPVAMVGDGVNDAPALAKASVGIAMGAAGTDVAIETADVVLMGSDLDRLPEALGLSQFSRRLITQNLCIALGVICVVSPLAALGFANLGMAVVLHEGSTVVVVLNSLRILRYRAVE